MSKLSFNMELGKQLKIERKRVGYTLRNVEYVLEGYPEPIKKDSLSRIEHGEINIDLYTINILASVYDVDINSFLEKINNEARKGL